MAEIATIARPYAEALFRASSDLGADYKSVLAWVEELAMIVVDPQLRQLADSPSITGVQLEEVITGAMRSAVTSSVKNFLQVVIENGRLQAIPEVAVQLRALIDRAQGAAQARVYSAFPLSEADLARLSPILEERFGSKLNLSVEVDPSLIGGVRVVVGDEVLDASVKASLEQMKAALTA